MIRLALLCLILSACHVQAHERPLIAAHVDRVIDADTYVVTLQVPGMGLTKSGVRLRLACIDAPESRGREKTVIGVEMKGYVARLIEGSDVLVSIEGDGGFGRFLSDVFVPGMSEPLSQHLYRRGAPLYTGSSTTKKAIEACRVRMG